MLAVGGDGQRSEASFEVGVDPVHWADYRNFAEGVSVGGDRWIIGT
jgi:hypothetical protein